MFTSSSRTWRALADGAAGARTSGHVDGDRVVLVHHWPKPGAPTVLLVHGIGMGQRYFGPLREELSADFDVVALDLPGFGPSPRPAQSLAIAELADLVATALTELAPTPCIAVGHSMGTQIVAELAARHPGLVERAVLLGPTVNPAERSGWQQGLRLLQDLSNDPPVVGLIGARLYLQAGPRWYLRKLRSMLDHDIRALLPRITQPTLVIRGAHDRVAPADWVEEVVAALPDGRLRTVPGRGHDALITGAATVARMIEEFAA